MVKVKETKRKSFLNVVIERKLFNNCNDKKT